MEIIKPGYLRVSNVLSLARAYHGVSQETLSARAEVGTRVHEAIAMDMCFVPPDLSEDTQGYFDAYQRWIGVVQPKTVLVEQRYYCDSWKITGAVDAVVKMPGEESLTIIDWKTSSSAIDYVWHLQAAFYHYLVSQNLDGEKLSDRVLFIKLSSDGKAHVKEYFIDESLYEICEGAATFAHYLHKHGKLLVE